MRMQPNNRAARTVDDLNDQLAPWRSRIEAALDARLPGTAATPVRLHEAMRYATLDGGKRIRACLVYAAGEATGADPAALDVPAVAVEFIHAFSLVHDDMPCMDDDDLRRGKPTCHRAYDEATALLVGDALQSLAFDLLATDPALDIRAERRLAMVALLARATGAEGMAGGQAIDIESAGTTLTLEALETMHARKTGELIRAATLLGALAAPAIDADVMRGLETYARAIGLAFQVVDDILDVTGDTRTLGKPQGSDIARDKPTYPALLGLNGARDKVHALHKSALESLAPLGDNGRVLAKIADFIIERSQ